MYVHLWNEKYDRGLDDIFAIQDEIAWRRSPEEFISSLDALGACCICLCILFFTGNEGDDNAGWQQKEFSFH